MILVETNMKNAQQPYHDEKMKASTLMKTYMDYLKEMKFGNEINLDPLNDPDNSKMIGSRYSLITSGRGSLPSKLGSTNPNVAAMIIDMMKNLKLNKGDHIAICATGSFPAMNLAVSAAAETLELEVSFIGSVTSSSWGANDPNYTVLDMYGILNKGNLLETPMIAASIGANQDMGRSLSPKGRELAMNAIDRNELIKINEGSLSQNISKRMQIFENQAKEKGNDIDAFINIGGGIASLGSSENSHTLPSGLISNYSLDRFSDKKGVLYEMTAQSVPSINLKNIDQLLAKYKLPIDYDNNVKIGHGILFQDYKYNLLNVSLALLLLIILITIVVIIDKKQHSLGNDIIEFA